MNETNTARILIVDDHQINLDLVSASLSGYGYALQTALNGPTALALVNAEPPDLILLDMNMPGMNGQQVLIALKADPKLQDIPVIFVSANDELHTKMESFKGGAVDYITKPFRQGELQARIATHVSLRKKQMEIDQLKQQELAALHQISRLKDDMLHMVSHDIKSPLSIIMSGVNLLKSFDEAYLGDHPETAEIIDVIDHAAGKILAVVSEVLDTDRIESAGDLQREATALTPYLQQQVDELQFSAQESHLELRFVPPPEAVEVMIAPARFSHVLQNLITNAIKYTPGGGWVEVSTQLLPTEIHIQVRDTGLGIPASDLPYLFEKFYRVQNDEHQKRTGSGLGLAIVKGIVEQHGGRVWAESKSGAGSTFTVSLPRGSQPAPGEEL